MKLVKRLVGLGIITTLSLTMATGVFAATKTQDLEVKIQSGNLTLDVPNLIVPNNITLNNVTNTYKIGINGPIEVKDLTGQQEGWTLTVSATPLTRSDNYQLPGGTLTINPVTSTPSDINVNTQNNVIDNGSPVIVASADQGHGMGEYELTFANNEVFTLNLDVAQAKEGDYESTITWNLVTGP